MDAYLILLAAVLVLFGLWTVLAHRGRGSRPRRRADPLRLRSGREILEARAALDAEDLDQMLEVHNARRRRRGEPERTLQDIERLLVGGVDPGARPRRPTRLREPG